MQNPSEDEGLFRAQMDRVLEALPALRRWLLRSNPRGELVGAGRGSGLPLSEVRTVIHLHQTGPQSVGELARGLGISYSTATECIADLERRGRVVKTRSETDRRQVLVRLTPEAEATASRIISERAGIVAGVLRQMNPVERQAFIEGVMLLSREAEAWMDVGRRQASEAQAPHAQEPAAQSARS
jgi:DNA-binding MarR family transcriptional regulator